MGSAGEVERMLADIRAHTAACAAMTGRKQLSERVLEAMAEIPRERFVPAELRRAAYLDGPLPIGHGQTISQPFIVALMSDLLDLSPQSRVLEVGTGCGYQTAVLSRLVACVFSLEIIPELSRAARTRLAGLGIDNVELRAADGYHGWLELAPFDAIMVTAAASSVPSPLVEQLAIGGRMVLPVGNSPFGQVLILVEKDTDGQIRRRDLLAVAFVPLTGGHD